MKKLYISIVTCLLLSVTAYAQHISPTNLIYMHRLWQTSDVHADANVYQYLSSLDANWYPRGKPILNEDGYLSVISYTLDHKSWLRPEEEKVAISIERGTLKRTLVYLFSSAAIWNEYLAQMTKMEAIKLGTGSLQGGKQTIYQVNDLAFALVEFPPGINGNDATYQVSIFKVD